jgi:multidrug resistance efflux pump
MKQLAVSFGVASLAIFFVHGGQPSQAAQNPGFSIRANSVETDGPIRHARGNVTFSTDSIEIRADRLDFNSVTGELEAQGHVTVESTPPSSVAPTSPGTELQPQLDLAQTRLERSQELFARGLIGLADLERAQQQVEQLKTQAAVQSGAALQSRVDAAQLRLARSRELADRGLLPRPEVERARQELDQLILESRQSSGATWTMQADSLRMQIRLEGR